MNAKRRQEIRVMLSELQSLRDSIEELGARLEGVRSDEQDAFDNIPESLSGSDRVNSAAEALDELGNASDSVESARDELESVIQALELSVGGC